MLRVVLNAWETKTTATEILENPATGRRQVVMTINLNPLRSTRKSAHDFLRREPCRQTAPFLSAFLHGVIAVVTLLQYLPWALCVGSPNFLLQQGTMF
jgi:hypothetical protein